MVEKKTYVCLSHLRFKVANCGFDPELPSNTKGGNASGTLGLVASIIHNTLR